MALLIAPGRASWRSVVRVLSLGGSAPPLALAPYDDAAAAAAATAAAFADALAAAAAAGATTSATTTAAAAGGGSDTGQKAFCPVSRLGIYQKWLMALMLDATLEVA